MAYTGPFPFNNNALVTGIIVDGSSFTGNVGNSGVVAPGKTPSGTGILVENNSTINGLISNSGQIEVSDIGIKVAGTTSAIDKSNIVKGIVNAGAGTITTGSDGIVVDFESKFTGGITNAGTISAGVVDLLASHDSTFTGGITNSGVIGALIGILVTDISDFAGGVSNAGSINAFEGIAVNDASTFAGNIINQGAIKASLAGGIIASNLDFSGAGTFSGTVSNSGAISAFTVGVELQGVGVSFFSGAIGNSAEISSTNNNGFSIAVVAPEGNFVGTISNSGLITASLLEGIVIKTVAASGSATFSGSILNSGAISTRGTGMQVNDAGASDFSGNITNSGSVASTSDGGIFIENVAADGTFTGSVINSGAISAKESGVNVDNVGSSGFSGGVTNSGVITSKNDVGLYIQNLANSAHGKFTKGIVNSGQITAGETGIIIRSIGTTSFAGGITNSGAVTSIDNVGISINNVAGAGTFTNNIANTAAVSAKETGVNITGDATTQFTGSITNSGEIIAATGSAIRIEDVANDGTFTGSIINSGVLSGHEGGLQINSVGISGFSGGITNSAAVTATNGEGVDIGDVAAFSHATFSGSIINSAMIDSEETGLQIATVGASRFSGSITNSGAIISTNGNGLQVNDVAGDGTYAGNIANIAGISAHNTGLRITNAGRTSFAGNITNSGAVTATTGNGISISAIAGNGSFSGNITNSGAVSAGGVGIQIANSGESKFTGNIVNTGAVTAKNSSGVHVDAIATDGTFAGSIINSGAVSAKAVALNIGGVGESGFSGGITNSGAITSTTGSGIAINSVAGNGKFSGNILNSAAISAQEQGFNLNNLGASDFTGSITNSGAVTAGSIGFHVEGVAGNGSFVGSVINKAAVSAHQSGISVQGDGSNLFSGTFANSGIITSKTGIGINIEDLASSNNGTFTGAITNSAAITAHSTGFNIASVGHSSFSGNISNSGAILSATNQGFFVVNDAASGKFSGSIVNTGAISAETGGFRIQNVGISGFTGNITNSGALAVTNGAGFQVLGVAGSGDFKGNIVNAGAITAHQTGIRVADAGDSTFSGNISNSGHVVAATGVGITVGNVADAGTFSGNIINTGVVSAHLTGLAVDHVGSTFLGSVTNGGLISAGTGFGLAIEDEQRLIGSVVNAKGGMIVAPNGIAIEGSTISGSILDDGAILASGAAILVEAGSKVVTAQTAVVVSNAILSGAVSNAGSIVGKIGIDIAAGPGVNVVDTGSITGSGGTAVVLKSAGDDFTLGAGYVVSGAVVGTAGDALQLGGAAAASFNLASVGTQYKGFTAFNVVGGQWTVSGSGGNWNVKSGGTMIISGGDVLSNSNVSAGGTAIISAGATLVTNSGGAAIIDGAVVNNGEILVSGADSVLEFDGATLTGGGTVLIDNGLVRITGNGSENIDFDSVVSHNLSGGLQIDDNAGDVTDYSGTVTGLGNPLHADTTDYIDLVSVTFASNKISGTYNSGTHVLTVSSGSTVVADINIAGSYATSNFHFASGVGGTVEITDPGGTLHNGGFSNPSNPSNPSGHPGHSANLALLGNYMATSFASSAPGFGGALIGETSATQQAPLAHPHTT